MKFKFHSLSICSLLTVLLLAVVCLSAQAQYLVSTKAGFVNRVEGKVLLQRQESDPNAGPTKATLGAQMRNGDRVIAGADSHAEILLSPGSYLRLNEKSEVLAARTDLSEIRFDLVQGSIIVEAGEMDKKLPIEVGLPQGTISIAKAGIYRFDIQGQETMVSVRRGEIFLGTRTQLLAKTAAKIGQGKSARLNSGNPPLLAKLKDKVFDDFDVWSYGRAETLVAANYSLMNRNRVSRGMTYGWMFDPFTLSYTFIPRNGLYLSPYGFGFYRSFYDCEWCYYYPSFGLRNGGGYVAGSSSGVSGGSGGVAARSGGSATGQPPRGAANGGEARHPVSREVAPGRQIEPYSRSSSMSSQSRSTFDSPSYSPQVNSAPSSRGIPSSPSISPMPSRGSDGGSPVGGSRGAGGDGGGRTVGGSRGRQ